MNTVTVSRVWRRMSFFILILAMFSFAACAHKGPAEKAGEKIDNAAEKVEHKAEKAGHKVEHAIDDAKDKANEVKDDLKD